MQMLSSVFHLVRKSAVALCFLLMLPLDSLAAPRSYFDMSEVYSSDITPFPKWTGMMGRFLQARDVPDDICGTVRFHPCSVKDWKRMVEGLKGKPLRAQLERVNDFGNAFPYITDQVNWGMEDYWETPYEFFDISGDCEDYAISKYYSMRALGVPADKMRIMIVQDFNLGGVIHAILGVYGDGTLYILDNQIKQLIEARSIYHYKPIYGINEQGWWAYHPRS